MKKLSISILTGLLLSMIFFVPASFAAPQSASFSGSMQYAYPGAGWGSVTYNITNIEDYSYNYTYKTGYTSRREFQLKATYGCPYSCELRWTNTYTNSSSGSQAGYVTHYEYIPGAFWTSITAAGTQVYKNSKSISSNTGSHLNVKTVMGFYANNSGSVYLGSRTHYSYLR